MTALVQLIPTKKIEVNQRWVEHLEKALVGAKAGETGGIIIRDIGDGTVLMDQSGLKNKFEVLGLIEWGKKNLLEAKE